MRVFTCPTCGHRMRLSGERCGKCFDAKPLLMTAGFYRFLGFALLLLVAFGVMARALMVNL
ncbi:hypothetical protein DKT77_08430 [Meridianimarinicoccus roseus]|uniref:Uncharacterized protein n=1 Tax=Meridianimarinicoccus roseus TaxID=2072018 RepID=A0A2V2LCV9_9RHOB|nr:hypothetical protein [Meridianimarinicoccus roseus]PWR02962.1 hypothetical protein DKT77_08430 [Meridianimarinicoccus roseus]